MSVFQILLLPIELVSLLGTFYLLLLTIAGMRQKMVQSAEKQSGRIAIVIPAHNEAQLIARTLSNLQHIASKDGNAEVVVIADNCTDQTAEIASAQGARVLIRVDVANKGKGYALDYAFKALDQEGFFAYLVIDADSIADDSLLSALRQSFASGAQAVQTRYAALTQQVGITSLALLAFNILRPRGRDQLGLSAGILGNGFALRTDLLKRIPYSASSIVEDLEYHLRLVTAGVRVQFCDAATVYGEMPDSAKAASSQRSRWEGGRLRMLLDFFVPLTTALLRGQWRMADPLLELLLPPLALHVLLLSVLALIPFPPTQWIGMIGLLVVMLHVIVAARLGGISGVEMLRIAAMIPAYMVWKLSLIPATIFSARRNAQWVRTQRQKMNKE